jgi:hypothetical protein
MLSSGNFKKNFLNSGEQVLITNAKGQMVMNFRYLDKFPWPEAPDGDGPSLVSATDNPTGDPNEPIYWKASRNPDGSPFYNDSYIVGVDELIAGLSIDALRIYPNPTNDIFNVQTGENNFETFSVKIYDLNGAILYASEFSNETQISLAQLKLSYGVYFVKIEGANASRTEKLIYAPE